MIHLKTVNLEAAAGRPPAFPFNLPVIQSTPELTFHRSVTFLVGENGAGKSTLLEAMAAGINAVTVGGEDVRTDPSLAHARALGDRLRFIWHKKTRRGFFLRAEDFFRFTRRVQQTMRELDDIKKGYDGQGDSYGLRLARGAIEGQKAGLVRRYGENPDGQSHGEAFFRLFQTRLVPGGLYLLDEPETPFSPRRQMALMVLIHDMAAQDCQFIIATHSPILMAFPGAAILNFDERPVCETAYEDLEHVQLIRSFLNHPERMLKELLNDSDGP